MAGALESARHYAVDTSVAQALEELKEIEECAAKYKAAIPVSELGKAHQYLRLVHKAAESYKNYHDNPPPFSYGFGERERDARRTEIWEQFKTSRVEAERAIGNIRNKYFPGFSIVSVAQWVSTTPNPSPPSRPVDPSQPVIGCWSVEPFERLYVEGDVYAFTSEAFVGNALPR